MKTKQFGDNISSQVITIAPVKVNSGARKHELELRISAPLSGTNLPVVIFAHGFGSSMFGYDPLTQYWAANGFVVIQPTFLDSRRYASQQHSDHGDAVKAFLNDPETRDIWRQRITDLKLILDQIDHITAAAPTLADRVDSSKIAVAGHSFGAHTAASLLGAKTVIAGSAQNENFFDNRVKAGILLSAAGRGGSALSAFATAHFPYLNLDYSTLTTATMVVAGDCDQSPLTVLGPEWFTDAYYLSQGTDALLSVFGGEHMLGGISGYLVRETTDENPHRVAVVRDITLAYLQKALYGDDQLWEKVCTDLSTAADPAGLVSRK